MFAQAMASIGRTGYHVLLAAEVVGEAVFLLIADDSPELHNRMCNLRPQIYTRPLLSFGEVLHTHLFLVGNGGGYKNAPILDALCSVGSAHHLPDQACLELAPFVEDADEGI